MWLPAAKVATGLGLGKHGVHRKSLKCRNLALFGIDGGQMMRYLSPAAG
jgi:hypothetical protein